MKLNRTSASFDIAVTRSGYIIVQVFREAKPGEEFEPRQVMEITSEGVKAGAFRIDVDLKYLPSDLYRVKVWESQNRDELETLLQECTIDTIA
jgi:hypothetical protein